MGWVLTPAMTLLPWVLSNHQEPEAPPCFQLAGLGPIFSARICDVVFSTSLPVQSSCLGRLSVLYASYCGGYLSLVFCSFSPAYCLGISGDMALNCIFSQSFQGASWA